ncbi:hypothetical protein EG329_008818 [Mollisiaceae sp. DMI_Dod_QoI]|nr:hypothetical protein EG329_008818 [Helotiales sp. DMI_Dod_QoI]
MGLLARLFLSHPAWDAVRERFMAQFPQLDRYAMDSLTSLTSLPSLIKDIKQKTICGPNPSPSFNLLLNRAHLFKAKTSQHSFKLHLDFMNGSVVSEAPILTSEYMSTILQFGSRDLTLRYNFYRANTIIANRILVRLGNPDESLVYEYLEASENIFKSLEYLLSLKPLGALWLTFAIAAAYGVSSVERREQIAMMMKGAFDPMPISSGPRAMDMAFGEFIGGLM